MMIMEECELIVLFGGEVKYEGDISDSRCRNTVISTYTHKTKGKV